MTVTIVMGVGVVVVPWAGRVPMRFVNQVWSQSANTKESLGDG